MASTNDITGDKLITKSASDSYRDGWDRIFGKKKNEKTTSKKKEQNEDSNHRPDPKQELPE